MDNTSVSTKRPGQLVVVSGKGGTGKTTITAALASLMGEIVLADCDVEASNLHLLTSPVVLASEPFQSGHVAVIDNNTCTRCGKCQMLCRFDAVKQEDGCDGKYWITSLDCEGCGVCAHFCPSSAITLREKTAGEWMVSQTRFGPLVHAQLQPAAESSGKLVSLVRDLALRLARETHRSWVLIDGPPGVSCTAIAAISGVDSALVVTEPSRSAAADMERALELTGHFRIPSFVVINKWDLSPELSREIEKRAANYGAQCIGQIRFSSAAAQTQIRGKTLLEANDDVGQDVIALWRRLSQELGSITSR